MRFSSKLILIMTGAALSATPAMAEKANQLIDVNGMSAASGERELRDRGFAFVSHERNSQGYDYSYWWHESDDNCVRVEEYGGRIQMISDATDQDCGHHLNSGAKAALGVAAGAAILGAIFGSKHDDDDRNSQQQESDREYDRGYTDGLHNASYHNRRGTDEYSAGYRAGVNQRNANLRHHERRGGYDEDAWIGRLVGASGSGAGTYMENQGFRPVDSFQSGNNGAGSVWFNGSTRQCVQMIVVNGRVSSAQDIGSHPQCSGGGSARNSSPALYDDQIGRRGSRARDTLGNRGFKRVARFGDDNTRYSIMWRAESNQCLQLMVVDGRVSDIRDIGSHPNCR